MADAYRPTGPVPGDSDYSPPPVKKGVTAPEWFLTQGGRYDPATAKQMLLGDAETLLDSQAGMVGEAGVAAAKAAEARAGKGAASRVRAEDIPGEPITSNWSAADPWATHPTDRAYVQKHTGWPGESGVGSVKDPAMDWSGTKPSPFVDELKPFRLRDGTRVRVTASKLPKEGAPRGGNVTVWAKGGDLRKEAAPAPDPSWPAGTQYWREAQEQWHPVATVKMSGGKLDHVVVRDQLQRQGLGTKLLEMARERFGLNPYSAPDRSEKGAALLESLRQKDISSLKGGGG